MTELREGQLLRDEQLVENQLPLGTICHHRGPFLFAEKSTNDMALSIACTKGIEGDEIRPVTNKFCGANILQKERSHSENNYMLQIKN